MNAYDVEHTEHIYIVGYSIKLDDSELVSDLTAEEIVNSLFDGDLESPDFDVCCGQFSPDAQILSEVIYESKN